jgi:hypothetical protein
VKVNDRDQKCKARKEKKKLEGNRDARAMWREDATYGTCEKRICREFITVCDGDRILTG